MEGKWLVFETSVNMVDPFWRQMADKGLSYWSTSKGIKNNIKSLLLNQWFEFLLPVAFSNDHMSSTFLFEDFRLLLLSHNIEQWDFIFLADLH